MTTGEPPEGDGFEYLVFGIPIGMLLAAGLIGLATDVFGTLDILSVGCLGVAPVCLTPVILAIGNSWVKKHIFYD